MASTHIDEKIEILKLKKTQIVSEIYYKKIKKEYEIADYIICQSSHVQQSFKSRGFKNIYLNISGNDWVAGAFHGLQSRCLKFIL